MLLQRVQALRKTQKQRREEVLQFSKSGIKTLTDELEHYCLTGEQVNFALAKTKINTNTDFWMEQGQTLGIIEQKP
jgi:allophanate hydrolase subunit 2